MRSGPEYSLFEAPPPRHPSCGGVSLRDGRGRGPQLCVLACTAVLDLYQRREESGRSANSLSLALGLSPWLFLLVLMLFLN